MAVTRSISRGVLLVVLIGVGIVLLLPVLAVYIRAFLDGGPESSESVFNTQRQAALLVRTLSIGLGAAACALLFGVIVGYAAQGTARLGRIVLACGCAASILTPPYVYAIAWIDIWGPAGWLSRWSPLDMPVPGAVVYSVPGAALTLAAAYYPIVAFAAFIGFRRLDPKWREATLVAGQAHVYLPRIAFPIVVRPIAAAALVVFLLAIYEFPVHSLLQVDTYLVEMYAAAEYHDYRAAALLSLPLVGAAALAIGGVGMLFRKREQHSDAGVASKPADRNPISFALGLLVVAVAGVVPIVVLANRAMPPSNFRRMLETAVPEFFWSASLGAMACGIAVVLGVGSALFLRHRHARAAADDVSALPFLISGPLLGLGLIAVYNHSGVPGAIYDSKAILLIAWTARYLFIAQWGIGAGVRGQPRGIRDAARVCRVSWLRTQAFITIPLAVPYILLAGGAVFVLTFREIDTAVLVVPPGTELASVRLFTLMHYGPDGYVMAMALTMCAICFVAGAICWPVAAYYRRLTNAGAD